jgi:hypothetical protein
MDRVGIAALLNPSWREMIGTLPSAEQAELMALLAEPGDRDDPAGDGTP